jgi:outer membrane protein assembly factor BamB
MFAGAVLVAAVLVVASSRGGDSGDESSWLSPNGALSSTRSDAESAITAKAVDRLRVSWRFRVRGSGGAFGLLSSTPLMQDGVAYVQDTSSSVYAIDLQSGRRRWVHRRQEPNDGPNGLALVDDRLYAASDTSVFALDVATGRQLWSTLLVSPTEQFVNITPVVDRGRVYASTIGLPPGGRGAIYGLDAATGKQLWRFDTIKDPWLNPIAGGGGAWQPLSVDTSGRIYAGIANPAPWGGSRRLPNGGWYRGQTLYTDSLVILDGASGDLVWYDQVLPHDVRDYDLQLSPILATVAGRDLVIGGGKGGHILAWDRDTHERLWTQSVGTHRNDVGPLPETPVEVCPGLFGGALTPMAYADGRVFVPVVELCMRESAVTIAAVAQRPAEEGTGVIAALDAATGQPRWTRELPSAPLGCATVASDVVFVPTYDGRIYGLSAETGAVLWRDRAQAGINGCPSVAGDTLLVPAGAPHRDFAAPVAQLIAYRLLSSE